MCKSSDNLYTDFQIFTVIFKIFFFFNVTSKNNILIGKYKYRYDKYF